MDALAVWSVYLTVYLVLPAVLGALAGAVVRGRVAPDRLAVVALVLALAASAFVCAVGVADGNAYLALLAWVPALPAGAAWVSAGLLRLLLGAGMIALQSLLGFVGWLYLPAAVLFVASGTAGIRVPRRSAADVV